MSIFLLWSSFCKSCQDSEICATSILWLRSFSVRSESLGKTERALAEYTVGIEENWSSHCSTEDKEEEFDEDDTEISEELKELWRETFPSNWGILGRGESSSRHSSSLSFAVKGSFSEVSEWSVLLMLALWNACSECEHLSSDISFPAGKMGCKLGSNR